MKHTLVILALSFIFVHSAFGQDFSNDKAYIDKELDESIKAGHYYDASDLMIIFAKELLKYGDTASSLEYQLRNCELVDNNLDYYKENGMTEEEYFSNWFVVISLEGWLGKRKESEEHFFSVLSRINKESPKLLPFYAYGLSFVVNRCNDSIYYDFIYLLQNALDIIKEETPSKELLNQYLIITRSYYNFCFNNSFNGVHYVYNRLPEIKKWYYKNRGYIDGLNTDEYEDDILQYNLDYAEQLYHFAGSISAQLNDLDYANNVYEEEIDIIKPLLKYNNKLSQKIAACYAHMSENSINKGDKVSGKIYSDLTRDYLYNYEENFEYCDILSSLAYCYFTIGNPRLAAHYKFIEIVTREKLGWHCSQSFWSLYFLYLNSMNDSKTVLKYQNIALLAPDKDSINSGLLIRIGQAYSDLMFENEQYGDTAKWLFQIADTIITIRRNNPEKYGYNKLESRSIYNAWARYYEKVKEFDKAFYYYNKALNFVEKPSYLDYRSIALIASRLHKTEDIQKYLPLFYYGFEDDILKMLPVLGTLESESFLGHGEIDPYHIFEWASWNQSDSVSICVAYDAALLVKHLTLRSSLFDFDYNDSILLESQIQELNQLRDSLYIINDNDKLMIALNRYAQLERKVLLNKRGFDNIIHWKELKNRLTFNEACIEFVRYTSNAYPWSDKEPKLHYAALVLSGDKTYPVFVDLFDEDELEEVYTLQPKSYDNEDGTILYRKIWKKMDSLIAGKERVFFSPMGLLNLINIELLSDSTGVTALEKYNLQRMSSTRQIIKPQNNVNVQSVISFGGIDYEEIAEAMVDSLNTRGNWNYLKNTLAEVRNIENTIKSNGGESTTITGTNATEPAFKNLEGTEANILHIASHGFYVPMVKWDAIPYYSKSEYTKNIKEELFYSGLVMSGGDKAWTDSVFEANKDDGILTSYEISKVDLHNVDLVVLSACETGLGEDFYDGIFGLQRAFKKAGVKSILMSLWNIDDKATSDYMGFFYNFLALGLSKHESYCRTVIEMRKKYQDPYYWASFVLLD